MNREIKTYIIHCLRPQIDLCVVKMMQEDNQFIKLKFADLYLSDIVQNFMRTKSSITTMTGIYDKTIVKASKYKFLNY